MGLRVTASFVLVAANDAEASTRRGRRLWRETWSRSVSDSSWDADDETSESVSAAADDSKGHVEVAVDEDFWEARQPSAEECAMADMSTSRLVLYVGFIGPQNWSETTYTSSSKEIKFYIF